MNANELSDELEEFSGGGAFKYYLEIATTLRQQQAKLEKTQELLREYTALHMKQQAEIDELKKDNKELHAIAQRMAMAEADARKSLQWMKDIQARGKAQEKCTK